MILLIYITGFVYTYWLIKRTHKRKNWNTTWSDIALRVFISFFSWIGVISVLSVNFIKGDYTSNKNSKPPKWM